MQFKFLAALALAPLALASGFGSEDSHALIARDLSGVKAQVAMLERRLAEAAYDEDDLFELSARSLDDEDDRLAALLRRAFPSTPTEGQSTRGHQQVTPGNIFTIDKELGKFRKGKGRSTEKKLAKLGRKEDSR